jgi:hypothetical protein
MGSVALLLGSTMAAAAADYCLDVDNVNVLVLKTFAPPGKGRCADARGFDGAASFFNGSVCKSSDGNRLTMLLTADIGNVDLVRLDLPAETGTLNTCALDTGLGGGCLSVPVQRIPCTPATVPVP